MASIALRQMDHLEEGNRRRKQIAEKYLSALASIASVQLPTYNRDLASSYFFLPLFFERRDDLAKKLYERGIRTRIYFRCQSSSEHLPGAAWYGDHELTLPINVSINDEEIKYIINTIKEGW